MTKRRKLTAILLALMLATALLPAPALAYAGLDAEIGGVTYAGATVLEVDDSITFDELAAVFNALEPGDTLLIHEGYYGFKLPDLRVSGTSDKPVTIKGYGKGEARPVFRNDDAGRRLWDIYGSYIDISYIEFSAASTGIRLSKGEGNLSENTVYGVTIDDCVFRDVGNVCLNMNSSDMKFYDVTLSNSEFLDLKYTPIYIGEQEGSTLCDNVVITDNFIDCRAITDPNTVGYAIQFKKNVINSKITRNLIINPKGPGIMTYGADDQTTAPNVVSNNVIIGSREECGINVGGGPTDVVNNIALDHYFHGIYIQNYGGRDLNTNITITNNTTGLTGEAEGTVDYTKDEYIDTTSNEERSVVVEDNSFYPNDEADYLIKQMVYVLKNLRSKPSSFDVFFDTFAKQEGPLSQDDLIRCLSILAKMPIVGIRAS